MASDESQELRLSAPPLPDGPDRIGRYLVIKTLARGGMATIYLARAIPKPGQEERWVAIKRPHPHLASSPKAATMILNEAKLVSRFDHENICSLIDFDVDGVGPYIVMPFLHGETLAAVIIKHAKNPGLMSNHLFVHLAACVCDGLHYAHNAKGDDGRPLDVIHRDISPQNIFVTFLGEAKILDFGVAKAIGFSNTTQGGAIKGKFAYMSPEQVRGLSLDRRSDVFSLGVVLWESLAAKRLFRRDTDILTAEAILSTRAPLLSKANPRITNELAKVIDRALEPDPKDRYQNAADFARALRGYLLTNDLSFGPTDVERAMASLFPARARELEPMAMATIRDENFSEDLPQISGENADATAKMVVVQERAVTVPAGVPADLEEATFPPDPPRREPIVSEPPPEEIKTDTAIDASALRFVGIEPSGPTPSPAVITVELEENEMTVPATAARSDSTTAAAPRVESMTAALSAPRPDSTTDKHSIRVPDDKTAPRRAEEDAVRRSHIVLGIALFLLAAAIALWARECADRHSLRTDMYLAPQPTHGDQH